jgi:hypothetical protein
VLVLGQPNPQLLMPSPVAIVTVRKLAKATSPSRQGWRLQLFCRQLLLDIGRAAVEDPKQRFFVEINNLAFDGLYIGDVVALWYPELAIVHCWSGRGILKERVHLCRDQTIRVSTLSSCLSHTLDLTLVSSYRYPVSLDPCPLPWRGSPGSCSSVSLDL